MMQRVKRDPLTVAGRPGMTHAIQAVRNASRCASLAPTLVVAFSCAFPSTGLSQASRPIGAVPDAGPGFRATLGECPAELLRRAWNEMLPLEAAAVEREVLALCTERAEAIARFLEGQEGLDRALAVVRAPAPPHSDETPVNANPGPADGRMEQLRREVASLRARIARLEGQPERPETEAALAELRVDLAAAEADLARVGEEDVVGGGVPGDVLPPVAGGATVDESASAREADVAATPDPAADIESSAAAPAMPLRSPTDDSIAAMPSLEIQAPDGVATLPPPGTLPPAVPAIAADAGPDAGRTEWRVIHAVRRNGGPWQVLLQADREIGIRVPGATPEDPDTIHWQPVSDPPVKVAVGETLPDGLTLLDVTVEGVTLTDPSAPDAVPMTIPFGTADDSAAGTLAWDFHVLVGEDR